MHITKEAAHIIRTLESNGFEAFVVGGCVRDLLRGKIPKDWDITTAATPTQVKNLFPRTFDTGIQHGTITVLENHQPFEVTTYRIDGLYTDARRPDAVTFTPHLTEDLSRRDFTVNAIAYNPQTGFADPFNGQADIKNKTIRCVGEPAHRFLEDALRMLRAVRFAATLGYAIEPATLSAITAQHKNLLHISAERINQELTRLINGINPQALTLLETTGLMPHILQGVPYPGNLSQTITALEKCIRQVTHFLPINGWEGTAPTDKSLLALTLFFAPFNHNGNTPTPLENTLRALRYDNKTIQALSLYTSRLPHPIPADPYAIKKHLRQMPQASAQVFFNNLLTLQQITNTSDPAHLATLRQINQQIHANNECYTLKNLAINGKDLAAAGIPSGKVMGDMLEKLLDTVMREPGLNVKEILLQRLHRRKENNIPD